VRRDEGIKISTQLRPGRQRLSRDEVKDHQRTRILGALETAMSANGYHDTSVADIIKAAGVSRQTFYELFSSKQDCFMAGWARRQQTVIEAVADTSASAAPMERFATLLHAYLTVMANNPALSRLYLLGVYAAGADAMVERLTMQRQFVAVVAHVLDARGDEDRFACRALVSAISTLVTNALVDDDPQALLALYEPLLDVARRLLTPR
jgi:TetR/AcrR family transcriptional regulator